MEFKALALGALVGISMTTASLTPAMADTGHLPHPTLTPIYCVECGGNLECSGAFSNFFSHGGHFLSFGETDSEPQVFVGARIDASGYPARSWAITLQTQGGNPFFVTELQTPSGVVFTHNVSSFSNNRGHVSATFNGPDLGFKGDQFISIFIYDNGATCGNSFQDTIDLSHDLQIDGILPIPEVQSFSSDCTGIFGNVNSSS